MVLEYFLYLNAEIEQGATAAKIQSFPTASCRRIFVLLKGLTERAPIKKALATLLAVNSAIFIRTAPFQGFFSRRLLQAYIGQRNDNADCRDDGGDCVDQEHRT